MMDFNSPEWLEHLKKIREEDQRRAATDLETRRKRRITVTLTDDQYVALQEHAKNYSISVDNILSNYVADLTCIHSNGSDERDRAASYFGRTWLAYRWN